VESNYLSNLSKEHKEINKNSEQHHCGSLWETSVFHGVWDYMEIRVSERKREREDKQNQK
jgi:hypothetical protein